MLADMQRNPAKMIQSAARKLPKKRVESIRWMNSGPNCNSASPCRNHQHKGNTTKRKRQAFAGKGTGSLKTLSAATTPTETARETPRITVVRNVAGFFRYGAVIAHIAKANDAAPHNRMTATFTGV